MKKPDQQIITRSQLRAARALLAWSQLDLSKKAKVAVSTIADFERNQRGTEEKSLEAMRKTLEAEGITFLPGGVVAGPAPPDLSRQPTRNGVPIKFITSTDLDQWADRRDSQALLPELLTRLIRASTGNAAEIEFPADESVQTGGWDGKCRIVTGTEHIPTGISGWESSTQSNGITGKANEDYKKRVDDSLGLPIDKTTFVFVTLRRWNGKDDWLATKRAECRWADVRAYDADNLVHWIEMNPAVGHWLAVKIGKLPPGLRQLSDAWEEWSQATKWPLSPELVLAGRDADMVEVLQWLRKDPSVFNLQAESPDEAIAFFYAVLQQLPPEYRAPYDARCLVAASDADARSLGESMTPLIIVMDSADPGLANKLVTRGHHVFVGHGSDSDAPDDVRRLERPLRAQIHDVLLEMKVPKDAAERLSNDCGRSLAILRRLMDPAQPKPAWAATPSKAMIAAMLAGAWDESSNDDKTILERLSGMKYDDLAQELAPLVGVLDSPVRKADKTWKIASRQDAWFRLARNVSAPLFDTFLAAAADVLSAIDPRYDLDPDDRWLAGIKNVRPKYSSLLRHGLAETLILSSLFEKQAPNVTEPAARVGHIIRTILTGADEKGWWSLANDLRLLAEASPDSFLAAVEETLQSDKKPITSLFQQDGGFFGGEHLSDLLWALEMLAWNPKYLGRVAALLADLDAIDPGGRYQNRPGNSLRDVFLLWYPQTYTPLEGRLRVLDRLRQTHPDQAWKLMLALLPGSTQSASQNPLPYWRDYRIDNVETVTYGLINTGAAEITTRLLADVGTIAKRWTALLDILENLDPSQRAQAVTALAAAADRISEAVDRCTIWTALRGLIHKHRNLSDAEWALPESEVTVIEAVYDRFAPSDLVERAAYLFDQNVELLHPSGGDFEADDRTKQKLQETAVQELLAAEGFTALMRLAPLCTWPSYIGRALANLPVGDKYFEYVYRLSLPSPNAAEWAIAHGLIVTMCEKDSPDWAAALTKRSLAEQWGNDATVRILHAMPKREETWLLATNAGTEVETLYWKGVVSFWVDGDARQIAIAVEALLRAGRARAAIELLGHYRKKGFATDLMMRTLEQAVREPIPDEGNAATMFQHYVIEIFKAIDANADADDERLGRLEWAYLVLLGESRSRRPPKALQRQLATDPKFFVEVLSLVFRPAKDSGIEEPPPTDRDKAAGIASQAFRLLQAWKQLPGMTADGTIDPDVLLPWVTAVRDLCKKAGRAKIGDDQIGQALSGAAADREGIWPPLAVRQVLETIRSKEFDAALQVGIHNRRGVTSRGPWDGGEQERDLAKRYRAWAKATELDWPRTSAVLERIADGYERDGRREDDDAERNDW